MKLEKTGDGRRLVHFRTWPEWLSAVEAGRKTSEVRLLRADELAELGALNLSEIAELEHGEIPAPDGIVLVSTADPTHAIQRRVTYAAIVGELVGSYLVLFCMEPAEELALEGSHQAPAAFVESGLRDDDGRAFYYRLGTGPIVPGVIE